MDKRIQSLERQLQKHYENLDTLKEQAAQYGVIVPLILKNQIDAEQEVITNIESELVAIKQNVKQPAKIISTANRRGSTQKNKYSKTPTIFQPVNPVGLKQLLSWKWIILGTIVVIFLLFFTFSNTIRTSVIPINSISKSEAIANGIVSFRDDFNSNVKGWQVDYISSENVDSVYQIIDGKYRVSTVARQDVFSPSSVPSVSIKNFWFSVDVTLVDATKDSQIYFMFRADENYRNTYSVKFIDGAYSFYRKQDGEWVNPPIRDQQSSEAVSLKKGETKTYSVLVMGSDFTVYANGQELGTVSDTTLNQAGAIWLGLAAGKSGTATVEFDNIVIKEISSNDLEAAEVKITATPKAATAEAIYVATATAKPEAINNGIVVFQEDFSSNINRWDENPFTNEYSEGDREILDGKYRYSMTSNQDSSISWTTIPNFFAKDFWLNVEATVVKTSPQVDKAKVYLSFYKDDFWWAVGFSAGKYGVFRWEKKNGEWISTSIPILNWEPNKIIKLEPGQSETFAVLVRGSDITIYANEQELGTVTDTVLDGDVSAKLGIGLSEAHKTLKVDFDNLVIKKILANQTDITQTQATATAQVSAAATLEAAPTATAIARKTLIANAPPIFQDNFTSDNKGWGKKESAADADRTSQIINGKYRWVMTSTQNYAGSPERVPSVVPENFWLSVEATIIGSSAITGEVSIGLNFRKDKNGNYYQVQFSNDGSYKVWIRQKGTWKPIQDWQSNKAIKLQKGSTTTFSILVKDSEFTIYADDEELGTVSDSNLKNGDKVELVTLVDRADKTVTIEFDNLLIKEIP